MHPTKNDLPQKTRAKVVAVLADRLADATDLMLQGKQAHWNVKGPSFIALHELFDKVVESAEEWVDLTAERRDPLGDQVHELPRVVGDLVEELVERDEVRPLHVPMRLLGLQGEIDGEGQVLSQQRDRFRADGF